MTTYHPITQLHFFVPGNPAAQGSKRHVGGGVVIESSKYLKGWRERIALAAHNFAVDNQIELLNAQPLSAKLVFVMPRPVSTPKSRTPPAIKRPDLDKLVRAVFDALTDVIYSDDAAITHLECHKRLATVNEKPGVHITIANRMG